MLGGYLQDKNLLNEIKGDNLMFNVLLNLNNFCYNAIHVVLVLSFFILSLNVPGWKMKVIGLLLTVVNYLLFLK